MSAGILSAQVISGEGKPRLMKIFASPLLTSSTGTTYTSTTAAETGIDLSGVQVGMRVKSYITVSGVDEETYGRITGVNDTTDVITVEGWSGGTPSNGKVFYVDGWVIDLPYCYSLQEVFTPDVLVHDCDRGDRGVEYVTQWHGWKYGCTLDYSQYLGGDTIFGMAQALFQETNDRLILLPRVDAPGFQHEVWFSSPVSLSRYGLSKGYKDPVFSFTGKRNLASWPIQSGYGYGYAMAYGTQY